jgi:hypothetical protein
MSVKTFFNTPWQNRGQAERIIILAGVGIIGFVGYRKLKALVGIVKQTGANIQTGTELGVLNQQQIKPSYTGTQYSIFADGLYSAMVDYWYSWGTDEDGIKAIMQQMINDADVLKLNQTFGTRDGYTLAQWFRSELSDEDLKYYVNDPMARNGVTFKF